MIWWLPYNPFTDEQKSVPTEVYFREMREELRELRKKEGIRSSKGMKNGKIVNMYKEVEE